MIVKKTPPKITLTLAYVNRIVLREGMLLYDKLIGVVDAVELVHSVKYYDDNTHSTELVTAFFIAFLILKLFEKILNYTKCDYLILDQAKLYPNQHEIQKLAEKCNIGKVPIIGNCFSHIIGLIAIILSKTNWHGMAINLLFRVLLILMLSRKQQWNWRADWNETGHSES